VRFTFDPAKSVRNRAKHGIDFEEAQAIWLDADRLEIAARTIGEPRWQVIGRIGVHLWSAIVTYRHDEETRIISVRRARRTERAQYRGLGDQ
jgi:uncharacterized DUF497 family protein